MEATQTLQTPAETQESEQKNGGRKLPRFPLLKKKKKWIRRLVIAGVAGLGVYWFVLRPGQGAGAGSLLQYTPEAVQRRDLTVSVSGTGTVTPIDAYDVKVLVSGEVLEAPFEEGDQVEKGDLLCRLDAKDAEMSIRQAELSVRQAQKNYQDLSANLTPKASAPGVVQQVLVQRGDIVGPGTPIAEIADSSTMTLTLPFQSADAQRLSPGQSAQVTLEGTMEVLPATVESVSSADLVGKGGALVRQVKLRVSNPGALTTALSATAVVGDVACAGSGNFQENLHQTVTAQASGEVTSVHVTAGSQVYAGTALVTLGGTAAASSLEDLSIAVENAQLALQRAQDALENYTITAPISGTVIEKNVKAGDKVDGIESGNLAVIYDLSSLKLQMNVNELNLNQVKAQQDVEITADALPGQSFLGWVEKISVNGTTTNGFTTYPASILLTEYGELNPGMNVSADIIIDRVKNALTIPTSAVNRGDTVMVPLEGALSEDGSTLLDPTKIEERPVTLGKSDGDYIEITAGLEEGDIVLVPQGADLNGGMAGG